MPACNHSAPRSLSRVTLETALGELVIGVDLHHAPVTGTNFLRYVDAGYYTNGRFYRATGPANYPVSDGRAPVTLVQGGINLENAGRKFAPILLERTSITRLRHIRGTVSMARSDPDSATSEFVVLLQDQPSLDFGGNGTADKQGAAAFGQVLSGLEVVERIHKQRLVGQLLVEPVTIVRASRLPQ